VLQLVMTVFDRFFNPVEESKKRSFFLFGPRQTGKTFLLNRLFPKAPYYNLLLSNVFFQLSQRPMRIREEILAHLARGTLNQPIIIDEVQKLPLLLDEVQYLIDSAAVHFILTGSSARKLKRGGANLLAGRARTHFLFPLVTKEISDFDLNRALNYGTLPSIYLSEEPWEDLTAYCGTYLQEEIQSEGAVRRIENFSRFLETAALSNGELLNFENVAGDCAVPPRTVREYFYILEDTLVGTMLRPFRRTRKRKSVSSAKFYFFDVGVGNVLAKKRNVVPKSESYGKVLEHFVFTELRAYLSYANDERELSFFRTTSGQEVDFIIGNEVAVEVKASDNVTFRDLRSLQLLQDEIPLRHKIVVSTERAPRRVGDIEILPVLTFLKRLWAGEYTVD
jgi:predicted AAA+ superfamily ATPase